MEYESMCSQQLSGLNVCCAEYFSDDYDFYMCNGCEYGEEYEEVLD